MVFGLLDITLGFTQGAHENVVIQNVFVHKEPLLLLYPLTTRAKFLQWKVPAQKNNKKAAL